MNKGNIKTKTARRIAKAMARANISKAELARRLGKSRALITSILQGNTNFTLESLVKIADTLGCDLLVKLKPKESQLTAQTNPLNALTVQQLEQLELAGIQQDKIIYSVHVTGLSERERNMQDIPESYIVQANEQANGGCIVFGWLARQQRWYANPSDRWLVKYLVERASKR